MELLQKIGEVIGVGPQARARQEEIDRQFTESLDRLREERLIQTHMLGQHSNACLGEIEYLFGITPETPHPGHVITFTECKCPKMLP